MRKIIILGCLGFDLQELAQYSIRHGTEIVTNNIETKNILNSQLQPEPLIYKTTHREEFNVSLNDIPRNKFIDKPRYNYRCK